ncbi:HNH endonuclease [Photobacterium lutimaris]|uniref:HNH endonuclease n=1 Tax=Photobacterium lutimaris TaxID=388278 RepID=A0A2T3J4H0_9GAMM|nr:HNH endonuclease [Photobacterium lutimaris]PSU36197.1 HNH endonuclease [Photobacterium lutimaris]TDR74932.1 HNH endonuclease [Photobacterium lutimaris]
MDFTNEDFFKGIILFGLNNATYKMGLAQTLLKASRSKQNVIYWGDLAESYFDSYLTRLETNPMPQQGNPNRLTKMERIVKEFQLGVTNRNEAIKKVADTAFEDVVPRFQTIGTDKRIVADYFYEIDTNNKLVLKDTLLNFEEDQLDTLDSEIMARWGLLEGAFSINQSDFKLANDIREIYLKDGYDRKALTNNIPFLSGYQGNTCFYCGEPMGSDIHVDHVLPRQVVSHDEIWNLVLAHKDCNLLKSDRLVGKHFIEKLIKRNENIMGSNHPWKAQISNDLGTTPRRRAMSLQRHYDNVKTVLGQYYWGGTESYNPATDPFFRRLITVLNNK